MNGGSRGQTATIGVILLFGIVAIGSMSILLVAGDTVSEVEQNAATEHVTQGFVELSSELETATYSSDTATTMDMAAGTEGAVRRENVGWIRINTSGFEENISLGAVIYESETGASVAYQAGGVWRGSGAGTRMVSAPPVHYEDSTLTLPIHSITGDDEITSGNVRLEHNNTDAFNNVSVVEDEVVTLEIKSDYYVGWKNYFAGAATDAVVDEVNHESKTVTIKLGRPELEGAFDNGVTVSEEVTDQGGKSIDDEEFVEGVSIAEFDPVIDSLVQDTNTTDNYEGTINGTEGPLTAGTYFIEEVDLTENLIFNLTDGDATLVVDGDISVEGSDLIVKNWKNGSQDNRSLKIYTTGNLTVDGEMCVDPCTDDEIDAEQLQVYGSSDTIAYFTQGGDGYFEGVLYAPSDDPNVMKQGSEEAQVYVHSKFEIDGGIVAGSAHFQSASNSFEYDPTLKGAELSASPEGYLLPPKITYLNVVVQHIDVENVE